MEMVKLSINTERLLADFNALARIGATPAGGINRTALSLEDLEARAWFADQVEAAGLLMRDDDAGNLSGVLPSTNPDARTLLIGSHLDSVPNGGRYDGSVGVLAGLECLRTIREAGYELPVHLEVVNFTDEEGTWYSLLGSRGMAGTLPGGKLQAAQGHDASFRAALTRAGINEQDLHRARRDPAALAGYLELHIEQGGSLDARGLNCGIVSDIVGRISTLLTFHGEAGHSGTTDMYRRRDALQGAALFVTQAHLIVHDRFDGAVVNCGRLEVLPGIFNIIPSEARLLLEVRHREAEALEEVLHELLDQAHSCAETYGLYLSHEQVAHVPPAHMDDQVAGALARACEAVGATYDAVVGYAGHDAQIMGTVTPAGMLFIPSIGAISHTPQEYTPWDDVVRGANVLLHTILDLAHP